MKYILLILSITTLVSCSVDRENLSLTVGEELNTIGTRIVLIDTLQVEASTFKFDSIVTSGSQRILVGLYTDPVFGETTSESYVSVLPTDGSFDLRDDAEYDSIALIMRYDRYFYNDTIPEQLFKVYEVTDDIKSDNDLFYNTTTFETNPIPIGEKTFRARPTKGDSLHISLDNAYGQLLFDRLNDNDINDLDDFLNLYKGISIKTSNQNTSILGFSTAPESTFVRLYYKVPDEIEDITYEKDFSVNSLSSFNHIQSDQDGTIFNELTAQELSLPSDEANNKCYIQAGTGLAMKIDIPHIKNLYDISGENGVLMSAKLHFKPSLNSYNETLSIKDSLLTYIVNRNSEIETQILQSDGTPVYAIMENKNDEFNTLTFTAPIDFFIQNKLQERFDQNLSLSFYPSTFGNSVDRYILDGEGSENNRKMTLEITYAIYEDED